MKCFRYLPLLALAALVSACAATEPASRAAVNPQTSLPPIELTSGAAPAAGITADAYQVAAVSILVPDALRVSEANVFYPIADIVWRGEPRGDRHQQVKNIYAEATGSVAAGMTSGRAVRVEVEVTRFHCLTEKTRYTVGGTHSLQFILTLRDAATGAIIEGPRAVIADVKAAGGTVAVAEEAQGQTQRVVVVNRLAEVLAYELTHHQPLNAPAGDLLSQAAVAAPAPVL